VNVGLVKKNVYYDKGNTAFEAGRVMIEPLEKGFGNTLGNALRRTLMRYIPGVSPIGLYIPDVYHEYTVIPGTATDVTELMLSLKKVRFEIENRNDEEVKVLRFKKKEGGFYRASDLELPAGVRIHTPDVILLNVTGEKSVELEIYIKQGRGYVDAKEHKEFQERPDVIKMDGMFNPVIKVGYEVENIRVGQDPTFERLVLTVTTDGSIHPKDAVMLASKINTSLYDFFKEMSDIADKAEIYQEKQEEEENRILNYTIEHLDLSVRSFNCLKREKYNHVRNIVELTERQLYAIHNLGEKSVKEIIAKIEDLGLELRKD
jgi:DNA-directed RNA polymerase subunit alpha